MILTNPTEHPYVFAPYVKYRYRLPSLKLTVRHGKLTILMVFTREDGDFSMGDVAVSFREGTIFVRHVRQAWRPGRRVGPPRYSRKATKIKALLKTIPSYRFTLGLFFFYHPFNERILLGLEDSWIWMNFRRFWPHLYKILTLEVQDQTKNGLLDGPCKGFPATNGQSLVFGLPGLI